MKKIIIIICLTLTFFLDTTEKNDFVNNNIKNEKVVSDYGIINIKKIKLNREFKLNGNIEKEIIALPETKFPNDNHHSSIIILASHSGTSKKSYFNYLYKLKEKDEIEIIYQKYRFTYEIKKIYYQKKNGKISIPTDSKNDMLVLTTCTNNNKKYQTIYIAILKNKSIDK